MSIQQTKKQDDLEKRLKLLRSQVYGKSTLSFNTSTGNNSGPSASIDDLSHLYQDLMRILVLSSIALAVQITLFILVQKNSIVLDF